ncbi:MAG: DUF3368 domain-containing protein [Lewinellaceae bacterium]|nr:DUF3368 domain-containing protein [Phaeodactylibacter sp.]MCB0615089.1 DUF3368 domain-containing protein [Phaeodactylibacter sp.]MCB9348587.1 DUF3368 domain-containing protein [Lewinellaceae bacterium]
MSEVVIADTSCLILLYKIGCLDLLKSLFSEVMEEYGNPLPAFIKSKTVSNQILPFIINARLGQGEATAIQLSSENPGCLLIIDELKGRKVAESLGIRITGTLGLLVEAKSEGHIKSVKEIIAKIKTTNFRFSEALENMILELSNEK